MNDQRWAMAQLPSAGTCRAVDLLASRQRGALSRSLTPRNPHEEEAGGIAKRHDAAGHAGYAYRRPRHLSMPPASIRLTSS